MPQDDEMQVGVFYARAKVAESGSLPIEMGGGEGNLVRIWACHWTIELIKMGASADRFIGIAVSSNPEHELVPLIDFIDYQSNKALYARGLWIYNHDGIGDSFHTSRTQVIPVYGLVRPRRQIMVWTVVNGDAVTGLGLEVYYTAFGAARTEREEVNRKFGKYRRS